MGMESPDNRRKADGSCCTGLENEPRGRIPPQEPAAEAGISLPSAPILQQAAAPSAGQSLE
jgi:hypothetical protein